MSKFNEILDKVNDLIADKDLVEAEYNIHDLVKEIETREHFVVFMKIIIENFSYFSSVWENLELYNFLEALTAFSEDINGYYQHQSITPENEPTWRTLATVLMGAAVYE